ncbi:MAG: hypothetical protein WC825_10480, partial [Gallionellaceae bacterium]
IKAEKEAQAEALRVKAKAATEAKIAKTKALEEAKADALRLKAEKQAKAEAEAQAAATARATKLQAQQEAQVEAARLKTGQEAKTAAEAVEEIKISPATIPPEKKLVDGVNWSDQQFWLVDMSDAHDRGSIATAWHDLLTRFPMQMKNRTILPRQVRLSNAGNEHAPLYKLFIAKFPNKQMAEDFCAILRAGQQRCGVVSSQSLAGKNDLNAPSATEQSAPKQTAKEEQS